MSNSKFEYVKDYEIHNTLLKGTFILVRVDGKAFTNFCKKHDLIKPNDIRAIQIMTASALVVCEAFTDIFLAYGQSDEYSFAFRINSNVYNRREQKIISVLVSTFTSAFLFHWKKFFPSINLQYPVAFDSRVVLYPDLKSLQDYFSWRQVDCHINNLYNSTFWYLILNKGLTTDEAHKKLKGTFSKDKHEILHDMGLNYNNFEDVYKKGTIITRFEFKTDKSNSKTKLKNKKNDEEKVEKEEELIDTLNINEIEKKENNEEYKCYDKTFNLNHKNEENLEFEFLAKYFYSVGLKIQNIDLIENKKFWEEVKYK